MRRSGAVTSGVVSLALLLAGVGSGPLAPSSATVAVLLICVTPAGHGGVDGHGEGDGRAAPAARPPMVKLVPAAFQPTLEAPALKVVLAGTVSVIVTPVAAFGPTVLTVSV